MEMKVCVPPVLSKELAVLTTKAILLDKMTKPSSKDAHQCLAYLGGY
jgi:hypothetical protein